MEAESFKEKRIREITQMYYSRQDVRKAIFSFSKCREVVPRYFEGFGKRPDSLQYDSDILSLVKKGATSFHCSEELWKDPLALSTELSEQELANLRDGWDLLIDIDCKYLEYSKKAAQSLIQALGFHGVKNIGVKFSGSKGFHIIIPWKAFPKEFYGKETREMFPDWPRMICQYLTEVARPILERELEKEEDKFLARMEKGVRCEKCKKIAQKVNIITIQCPACKRQETSHVYDFSKEKTKKCPDCRIEMIEKSRKPFYSCQSCNITSLDNSEEFKERASTDVFKVLGVDVVLVSPRHLFRMPYSLHEKTSLVSVVLDKEKISEFQVKDADPLKVQIKNFYPEAEENEARELLIQAIDWKTRTEKEDGQKTKSNYKEIIIKDLTPNLFPPCITEILNGIKQDGRKRALFILLNFFKSLNLSNEEIEKRISEWNSKNYNPLRQGYVTSQLSWHKKQKAMLPPNCDKPHYKDLISCHPDGLCRFVKNPVNYTVKKNFMLHKKKKQARKSEIGY